MSLAAGNLATAAGATANLLEVRGLVTEFRTRSATFRAVRGLDLTVRRGRRSRSLANRGPENP